MVHKRLTSGLIGALTIASLIAPSFASAANVSVNTQILINRGSGQCQSPVVSNVTPYVYDNALNSFDITLSDASYVAILGSAGNTGIRLDYLSRRASADGSVTTHVDLPPTAIPGSLNVTLTLLSSPAGQPTCITVVSFPVAGKALPVSPAGPGKTSSAAGNTAGAVKSPTPSTTIVAPSTSSSSTAASSAPPVVGGGVQSALSQLCSAAGPYQLWFILLALFMVGVGLVAFAEPPLARKSAELPAALILVPLVLLLLFWYVTPACRVAVWIPVVLLVAAAVALIAAYREQAPVGKVLPLLPATPKPQTAAVKSSVPMKQTTTSTIITPAKSQQTTTVITPQKIEQTKTIITPAPKNPPPQSPQSKK